MEVEMTEQQRKKLQRAADITSIQMLMARYIDHMSKMSAADIFDKMFVKDSDDVSIELFDGGEYCGEEHVRAFLDAYDAYLADPSDKKGWMELQLLCTPYIKLSKDGTRAMGTWSLFSPSAKQATPYPCDIEKLTAIWVCGKYFCEFRKVDGSWKILKLRSIAYLRSAFELGWTRQADCISMPVLPGMKPDKPSRSYLYNFDYGMGNGGIEWGPYMPENGEFK